MTHGTILISSLVEDGTVLLQTPHDGHTNRALRILTGRGKPILGEPKLGIPQFVADRKRWRVRSAIENHVQHGFERLSAEYFRDMMGHHEICSLNILDLASMIIAVDPMIYRIIPPGFEDYLPDYDRTGHLMVRILDDSRYRILRDKEHGIHRSITVNLFEEINKLHLRWAWTRYVERVMSF